MGRAERRRQERQDRIFTKRGNISLSPYELRQIKRQAVDDIATFDVELLQTCFAMVLYEEFGFDFEKIHQGLSAIDKKFGQILSGEMTADGLAKELEEKTGIEVKFSKEW